MAAGKGETRAGGFVGVFLFHVNDHLCLPWAFDRPRQHIYHRVPFARGNRKQKQSHPPLTQRPLDWDVTVQFLDSCDVLAAWSRSHANLSCFSQQSVACVPGVTAFVVQSKDKDLHTVFPPR